MAMCGPTTNHGEIRRWAKSQNAIPCEILPYVFDSEPALLRFVFEAVPEDQKEIKPVTWEHFFALFDVMGLSLVYDDDHSGKAGRRHELLQIEERSAYRFEGKPI